MERYFFHLHECGTLVQDEEGRNFPDAGAAHRAAIEAARDVMAAEIREGKLCVGCCIEVRDASGEVVLTVPFKDAVTITGL